MGIKFAKPTAKQKSLILSVLAGIGVVATGVISARCAKKTNDEMPKKDKVKAYIPAVVTGAATVGCIAASTYISGEEIAAVTAASVALGKRFADYKKAVEENISEEQRERIDIAFYEKEIDRLEQELAERERPTEDDDLATFVDAFTGYTFKGRKDAVDAGIRKIRKLYDEQEYFYWCDIFYVLNNEDMIPYDSALGAGDWMYGGWGWSKAMYESFYGTSEEDYFDIYLRPMVDHENTYIIDYGSAPEPGFMEY